MTPQEVKDMQRDITGGLQDEIKSVSNSIKQLQRDLSYVEARMLLQEVMVQGDG